MLVTSEVQRLLKLYKGEEVSKTVTGHSSGAAVSTLNAVDIVANGYNKGAPVSDFVFSSPGVGDNNFKRVVSGYKDLIILRIKNEFDILMWERCTQGTKGGFKLDQVINRDITLINKYLDIQKDEHLVPASWYIEKNKGMVQEKDGSWKLKDYEVEEGDKF
ncbi:putative phospholipase A(1) [Lupinus albus]|uniref:Phospholipase A1 n=1 Tax=Lupinus albus TaxID=3870 RepID=A0A6A4PNW8_LUPAL|nr:putative phospholipase A(1) [Lupinus albus]